MANPNALIVEVVGDTSKLTASLSKADKDLQRFAGRASSWDKRTAATGPAGGMLRELEEQKKAWGEVGEAEAAASRRADEVNGRMRNMAVGVGIAGVAANRLGANLQELGGNAAKFGNALSAITSGNIVGFVKALQSVNEADPAKIAADLLKEGDAAKATAAANAFAAAGFDKLAEAAKGAATQLLAVETAAHSAAAEADVAASILRASGNDVAAFGEQTGRFGRGPGAMAEEARLEELSGGTFRDDAKKIARRKGITADQRNTFFDNRLRRELDRVQDLASVKSQVSALRGIAAEIQNRINATKDITRRLTLEDSLVEVNRRAESLLAGAAVESARLAKERADAEEKRLAELKRLAAARRQARDDLALGLQTPGAPNLRRQLDQLSSRGDIGSIPNKLAAAMDGASRILKRKSKDINEETRGNIASLFETIRDELNKGATGGPLTKTTQLSERILAGLGLSANDERLLRARISHFNSAGTALAGSGSGSGVNLTSYTVIDGKTVATTSAKYNRRTVGMNPSPRNGPNAGGWTGRG